MKFYIMDVWFKQWDYVFYLDAGMHIFNPISRIQNVVISQKHVYAHSDSYPTFEWKLRVQVIYFKIVAV